MVVTNEYRSIYCGAQSGTTSRRSAAAGMPHSRSRPMPAQDLGDDERWSREPCPLERGLPIIRELDDEARLAQKSILEAREHADRARRSRSREYQGRYSAFHILRRDFARLVIKSKGADWEQPIHCD
ncbi:MAG: hypothetical protein M3217_07660 [Actinomycetota bacterium]|nr:hypothetical protein [Actinomycetota bacterium]